MSITFDNTGTALVKTVEGVSMPVNDTFDAVNNYVHSQEVHFEELQGVCLGLANSLDKLKKKLEIAESLIDFELTLELEDRYSELDK